MEREVYEREMKKQASSMSKQELLLLAQGAMDYCLKNNLITQEEVEALKERPARLMAESVVRMNWHKQGKPLPKNLCQNL